jgi:excisionase family DNA binding protein
METAMAEEDYMTVAEAMEYLGIGNKKMAKLLKEGTLPWQPDPLDGRSKLINRSDVDVLMARSSRKGAA